MPSPGCVGQTHGSAPTAVTARPSNPWSGTSVPRPSRRSRTSGRPPGGRDGQFVASRVEVSGGGTAFRTSPVARPSATVQPRAAAWSPGQSVPVAVNTQAEYSHAATGRGRRSGGRPRRGPAAGRSCPSGPAGRSGCRRPATGCPGENRTLRAPSGRSAATSNSASTGKVRSRRSSVRRSVSSTRAPGPPSRPRPATGRRPRSGRRTPGSRPESGRGQVVAGQGRGRPRTAGPAGIWPGPRAGPPAPAGRPANRRGHAAIRVAPPLADPLQPGEEPLPRSAALLPARAAALARCRRLRLPGPPGRARRPSGRPGRRRPPGPPGAGGGRPTAPPAGRARPAWPGPARPGGTGPGRAARAAADGYRWAGSFSRHFGDGVQVPRAPAG